MNTNPNEITINGITHTHKTDAQVGEVSLTDYCIVRTDRAGCFAGRIVSREGSEGVMDDCRRLWWWEGAATLSQLAMEGTKLPEACKFPAVTQGHTLLGILEILPCTAAAKASIENVPVWTA